MRRNGRSQTNPASPLICVWTRMERPVRAPTRCASVSFFKRSNDISDLAQVRYVKGQRTAGSAEEKQTHWIATIQYVYGEPSKDPKVRRWRCRSVSRSWSFLARAGGPATESGSPRPATIPSGAAGVAVIRRASNCSLLQRASGRGLTFGGWAEQLPVKGAVDSRIRVAVYNAEQVYRLYAYVGYQIDLEFEPGETYVGIGGGDLEGLTVGAFDNHLLLKPKAANVGTNLAVLAPIAFRLTRLPRYSALDPAPESGDGRGHLRGALHLSRHRKARGPSAASERVEADLAQASAHRARNLDYWFCGNEAVRPVAASDDGVHTRLTFGAKAELPAIFVRNDDGSESLLNFSIDEGDVIVHRVARRFILRRGRLTGCIVNKGFVGGGERLESGTVAPDVRRDHAEGRLQPMNVSFGMHPTEGCEQQPAEEGSDMPDRAVGERWHVASVNRLARSSITSRA